MYSHFLFFSSNIVITNKKKIIEVTVIPYPYDNLLTIDNIPRNIPDVKIKIKICLMSICFPFKTNVEITNY